MTGGVNRLGILGGTFNPIHLGHIGLAQAFISSLKLDLVLLMPASVPPHKEALRLASASHRLNMCQIAARGHDKIEVSRLELERGGKSFTADTLRSLKELYPNAQLYLITGADMFLTLQDWREPETIFSLAAICTAPARRRGQGNAVATRGIFKNARRSVRGAQETNYAGIFEYHKAGRGGRRRRIPAYGGRRCGIYQDKWPLQGVISVFIDDYKRLIKSRMGEKRYIHSLNVAKEAVRLAKLYGADVKKAEVAGLLHDVTKETPPQEQLKLIKASGIILSEVQKVSPKLWHAISGAAYIRMQLSVTDPDIVSAIRFHTTGRAQMSLLEKVIFVADFTGEERDYDGVEIMRRKSGESLEEAMLFGLSFSIADLAKRDLAIDPNTLAAYNQIVLSRLQKQQEGLL